MNTLDVNPIKISKQSSSSKGPTLRSSHSSKIPRPMNKRHMFPDECIICKERKYHTDRFSRKRSIVKLITCEKIQGGQLLQAAEVKQDQELLEQIKGEDLVARELRYHARCYKQYTNFLSRGHSVTSHGKGYTAAFDKFSKDVITERLVKKKEILTLGKLNRLFIQIIKEVEGVDAPYRTWNLKRRLETTFPQLEFVKSGNRTMSDIVFASSVHAEDMVEKLCDDTTSAESTTTDEEQNSVPQTSSSVQKQKSSNEIHTLFNAALIMKSTMSATKPPSQPWPPSSKDLSIGEAKKFVPHQLYNFISWMVGASTDPVLEDFVSLPEADHLRVISIAQDIIFLSSKGKLVPPKHLSLASTVRHISGCSQLVGILNGLGHCVSHTTLLEYNTALAMQQISHGRDFLPQGIQQSCFTTLVWDNIDFAEDTISGHGTTHSTNGVMIQRCHPISEQESTSKSSITRTGARSITPSAVHIPPFHGCGEKRGPQGIGNKLNLQQNAHEDALKEPQKLDMAYNLIRLKYAEIPGWTGFNTLLSSVPQMSVVAYLPVIDSNPTQMDTVQMILKNSISYADRLDQEVIVLVFDQAIYSKAQQIRWQNEEFQKRLVIRLGMFHTKIAYLACIGKRFREAGLADILVESGIVAHGSLNSVMNGHHYNRSVRAHKVMYEALCKLQWQAYLDSLNESELSSATEIVKLLHCGYLCKNMNEPLQSSAFNNLVASFKEFISKMVKENATFAFWASYVEMVQQLLFLTRATRTGNWELHLAAIRNILPWMFACDRTNYARYLPAYYLEMCDLPETHPSAYEALVSGEFAVQRNDSYGFAQVECDLCIEQTCNRDSKTKGGIIGYSTNSGAVLRWLLTQHECSAIMNECKVMAGKSDLSTKRKVLSKSSIDHDTNDIDRVITTIDSMFNPFEVEGGDLLHISSGVVASERVKSDLLSAENVGNEAFIEFAKHRLQAKDKEKDIFFTPIKKKNLATFEAKKKTTSKVKGKAVILKADRKLFARLMLIGKARDVKLKEMFTYCLSPMPLPFATPEGTLVKTNKALLMHCLESTPEQSPLVDKIPPGSVWVIDGMAMLQQLNSQTAPSTFYQLALHILQKLVSKAIHYQSTSVHFVSDTYPSISIKNAERIRRAATGTQIIKIQESGTSQKRPTQWKKYLSASENKEAFVNYLYLTWAKLPTSFFKNVTVYIAHGAKCHALSSVNGLVKTEDISELECNHEEADTRLLLHAAYIQRILSVDSVDTTEDVQCPAIVIQSLDTDVLIISLGFAERFTSTLLFHTGRGTNIRTIDVSFLQRHLGTDVTSALLGLHPFTGCDSVSGFFGKGKTKALKLLMKNYNYQKMFQDVGASFDVSSDLCSQIEEFVCHLYCQNDVTDVNQARYNMFRLGTHAEESLPPNRDALMKHLLRANYQAAVFRCSLQQFPDIPSPDGKGWTLHTDEILPDLQIDWGDLPPAPEQILELMHCTCKKGKCQKLGSTTTARKATETTPKCCSELGLRCTELCTCLGCKNVMCDADDDDVYGDLDDDDE
ncbi:hypothetical protein HOLleu_38227 [Holothuria leucospilota]|uniref:Tesmin/TSO1-like CXC domain-containing protein n=1 Tax=Holothuria leucospilota TaxID=206669 RepID=A0A9Q1BFW9_HOLLE|nr:hypothetical protein HOLleu_38227 [Holothuria leucospilota]